MIELILAVIFILWLLGFIQVGFLDAVLFNLNGMAIDVKDIIIFLLVLWLIGLLPRPFREITAILFILWLLSLFGVLTIAGLGLSNILIFALIVGAVIYLIKR
jgi:hypothetical protein